MNGQGGTGLRAAAAGRRLARLLGRGVEQPWSSWFLTRLSALALGGLAFALVRGNVFYDVTYYGRWAHGTLTGVRVPYRDFAWEYPPAALPVMLLPGVHAPLMHLGKDSAYLWLYSIVWVTSLLALDAAVLRSLLRRTTRWPGHPAVTLWVWALPLLGAFAWARYDLLPAVAGGLAVLAAGTRATRRSGGWAGLGAALKLWPMLLAPVQRTRRAAIEAIAGSVVVVCLVAAGTFALTGTTGFGQVLSYQSRRGLQCESMAALPVLWLRHLGVDGYDMRLRFGAWEVVGPHVQVLAAATSAIFAVGVIGLGLAHWRFMRRDAGPGGVAQTAMALLLLTLVTDKVLSPQYLLWLVAVLVSACILDPDDWRPFVPWVLLVCGLTALAFPWFYGGVLGAGWIGLLALTARDAVVMGMAVAVARQLARRLRTSDTGRQLDQPPLSVDAAGP
jgi:hypothetical protein